MEPESSLPRLQKPATCPYSQPDQSSPCPLSHFLNINLNIILPSKPGSCQWSLSGFRTKILYAPLLSPIRATYRAPLIIFNSITHIVCVCHSAQKCVRRYCDWLLARLAEQLKQMELVRHPAVRSTCRKTYGGYTTAVVKGLHWLLLWLPAVTRHDSARTNNVYWGVSYESPNDDYFPRYH